MTITITCPRCQEPITAADEDDLLAQVETHARAHGGAHGTHVPSRAAVGLIAASNQDVTRPRLEKSLAQSFANLYLQEGVILGTPTTAARINARPTCDRGGPTVKDVGPGADWICMMNFTDLVVMR